MKKILLIILSFICLNAAGQLNQTSPGTRSTDTTKVLGTILMPNLPAGVGTKALRINAAGKITTSDTTTGTGTEGTYTPTLTNVTNVAASTAFTTRWVRIGDWYHVYGEVDIDATLATTKSELGLSLPVSSVIGQTYNLSGTGAFDDNTSVQIAGDVTNNRARLLFTPQTATNNKYSFHFSFKYVPA